MHKIEIPHLTFEGQEIKPPVGLSELLESAWTKESEPNNEIVNGFHRNAYKNNDGRWVTKFERKVIQ